MASEDRGRQEKSPIPSLSLPKGGGALRGIDEKLATNPSTGTGSLKVTLPTSPARGGSAPGLELAYDSGAGNGPFGIGWRLSVPAIARKTDQALPRYVDADESDVFVLSGAEDLVPVPGTVVRAGHRIQRYRPRIEGLFARIERWSDLATGDSHWRTITRDNVASIYGRSAAARIADPADARRVFSWLIEESRDDRGNVTRYRYKAEDGAGVDPGAANESNRFEHATFLATAQRYLARIQYGNVRPIARDEAVPESDDAWMFEVVFDYGERAALTAPPGDWAVRRDPFSSFRPGFEVRTYRLCRRVLMLHRFPGKLAITPCLVRSTDFTYDEGPVVTYLTSVTQAGYVWDASSSGYRRSTMPSLDLGYIRPVLHDELQLVDPASLAGLPAGVDGERQQWVDLDGEGLPGVLTADDGRAWCYKRNQGQGRLAPPERQRTLPAPAELGRGTQLTDLAGDGLLDLVTYAPPMAGYFSRTADGGWRPFRAFAAVPNLDFGDRNLRFLDLNGDGRADLLITTDDALVWYEARAYEGFAPARRVPKPTDERQGPAVVFADASESIFLADMAGDGLVDIVRVRNGDVCYWPNLGYGQFGRKVTMAGSPRLDAADQFDPGRIRFADVDGSGTSDLLYLGREGVAIFFNQAGNGFAPRELIRSLPTTDSATRTTIVDLLGQGTACLVWSSPSPARAARSLALVDLMGGRKPHLLETVVNNLGAETTIVYAPSTRFYLDDQRAGIPWITRLPFPVHVVERTEVRDRISKSRFVTRYAYHHGYFDGVEREFRGFGRVDQWDTEEFEALAADPAFSDNLGAASHIPPVLTKTWYHTGAFTDGERISRLFEHEYYREPGLSDAAFQAQLLPDTVLPSGLTTDEAREACRALRGSLLRQEVYALDGSARSPHPYSVSERDYTIRLLAGQAGGRHAVFFTHAREVIDTHYERDPSDPRVSHALTLDVDDFGNVLRAASIGYGRRQVDGDLSPEEQARQTTTLATYSENDFTNAIDVADAYRGPAPCEQRLWELTGLGGADRLAFAQVREACLGAAAIDYERTPTPGLVERRLVEKARTRYRRDDLDADLPLGALEPLALPGESYRLALTPGLVAAVYGDRVTEGVLAGPAGYIHSEGDPGWWVPSGRVFFSPGSADTAVNELAFAQAHFFLPCRLRDAFGATTTVRYDAFDLLTLETEDAVGNKITAGSRDPAGPLLAEGNDYRVLQPALMMDANRNRAAVAFDALGQVVGTCVMGKPEERLGDSLDGFDADLPPETILAQLDNPLADPQAVLKRATTRLVYDLFAFERTKDQPAVVYTIARETHDADLLPGQATKVQHRLSYSDGFGRVIQAKALARPDPQGNPRWIVSGWTVFNNKGKPVRQYEPFFSATPRFEFATKAGVSPILFYDPVGRVVGTLHPDHTYDKVVFGPWRRATWDASDSVLEEDPTADPDLGDYFHRLPAAEYLPTWYAARAGGILGPDEAAAAAKSAVHAGTPTLEYSDTLGRPFLSVAHNRFGRGGVVLEEKYRTRTELDIEGQPRELVDTRARTVVRYAYDLVGARIYDASMEAGERRVLTDVAGKPVLAWDSRGHCFRTEYDALRRPLRRFVIGAIAEDPSREILFDETIYGEAQPQDTALNVRGQVVCRHDAAGRVVHGAYDFKGNVLRTQRELAKEYRQPLDWLQAVALEERSYPSSVAYDALNRPVELTTPDLSRSVPIYDEAGLLGRLECNLRGAADRTVFLADVEHNARGQRERVVHGNGVETAYTYDQLTFRPRRLHTTRAGGADALQDLGYVYDALGNITHIADDAQQTIFFRNRRVDPTADYTYDAVGRLIEATGRELLGLNVDGSPLPPVPPSSTDAPRVGLPHPNDGNALGRYLQRYVYDEVGNFLQMIHRGPDPSQLGWTRTYAYEELSQLEPAKSSNRLSRTQFGDGPAQPCTYDAHGNLLSLPELTRMDWDYADRLGASVRQVVSNGGTPETTYYVYDGAGERVRKVTERQASPGQMPTRKAERIYLGAFELYDEHAGDGATVTLERETLHVTDGDRRAALVETRTIGDDGSPAQLLRFQYGNHIGSSALEVDENGKIISYEEYYPYGSTSYQAVRGQTEAAKRYRFIGKERDEETGLLYCSARYYCCWLGRWTAVDPLVLVRGGPNAYAYAFDNPLQFTDPGGRDPDETKNRKTKGNSYAWPDEAAMCGPEKCLTDREIWEPGHVEEKSVAVTFVTTNEKKYGPLSQAKMLDEQHIIVGTNWMVTPRLTTITYEANGATHTASFPFPRIDWQGENPAASYIQGAGNVLIPSRLTSQSAPRAFRAAASLEGWLQRDIEQGMGFLHQMAAGYAMGFILGGARIILTRALSAFGIGFRGVSGRGGSDGPGPTTRLFHGGKLRDGEVKAQRFSTTTDPSHAAEYSKARSGGQVYEFEVPTRRLYEMEASGGAMRAVDNLSGTGSTAIEWRFFGKYANELNKYIVRGPK